MRLALATQSLGRLGDGVFQRLQLGLRVATLALSAGQRIGAGGEPGVVRVELTAQLCLVMASGLHLGACCLFGSAAPFELGGGDPEALLGLFQRRGRCPAAGCTDAPPSRAEAVAVVGDHDGVRVGDRQVDGVGQRRNADGRSDDGIQQLGNTALLTAYVRPNRSAMVDGSTARRWAAPRAITAPCTFEACSESSARRPACGEATTTASSASPSAASTAASQPESMSIRSSNVPSTSSTPARCSAPARAAHSPGKVERLGTCSPSRDIVGGRLARCYRRLVSHLGGDAACLGSLDVGHQSGLDDLRLLTFHTKSLGIGIEPDESFAQHVVSRSQALQLTFGPVGAAAQRAQLAAHLGGRAGRRAGRHDLDRGQRLLTLDAELDFLHRQPLGLGPELPQLVGDALQLDAQVVGVGLEAGDHAGIHQLSAIALHRTTALDEHRGDAAGPLAQLLDANHLVGQVEIAASRQIGFGRHHTGVEAGQLGAQLLLRGMERQVLARERGEAGSQRGDLPAAQEDLQRAQLGDEVAVPAGGIGLAFERSQLAANLAQQILHTQQAGLGGVEAAFGSLLAAPELQDSGSLFDDRPPLLRPSIQHRVDLALADDHVLLPADTCIAEQFLHVEQPARDTVDRVFALAGAEQDSRHGDLGELDRQQPGRVVDGQRDLGPAERRPLRRAGEDDVVHLLAAHRAGCLRAEHPGDGVDHVGLAGAVGPDHHRDPRLELEGGCVGERLESFEGQRLQEHGSHDPSRPGSDPPMPTKCPPNASVRRFTADMAFRSGDADVGRRRLQRAADPAGGQRWQRGQKQVERPPETTRTMVALPHVRQRCPARS